MSKNIPPLDLMFLLTETADSPKHVSALLTFDAPEGGSAEAVREIVAAYRAAQPVPPFTWVADFAPAGLPRWTGAPAVELRRHVHHLLLPAGADRDELDSLLQSLHESMLDRSRPGFDLYFIEGLPGGGFALFVKLHHAIVDGASAMALLLASMADSAAERRIQPFFALQLSAPKPRAPKALTERLMALQKTARVQGAAAAGLYVGLVRKGIGRLLGAARAGSEPFAAVARTPLNATIRTSRSIATLSLPIDEMRAAGKAFGGTLNDVAVTIVDAGLHRYLEHIGQPVMRELVAMCPVSLREPGDKEATTKVSALFAPLAAATAPVGERMQQVIKGIAGAKAELGAMSKDAAMLYAIAAFGFAEAEAELARLRRSLARPVANFVLSNVPGSPKPLYLNGARLTGMYPISSIAGGMGLNVTLASYAGSMDFGFVGNGVALPHLSELARFTREAFDELKAAAAKRVPPDAAAAGDAAGKTATKPAKKAARKAPKAAAKSAPQAATKARRAPKRAAQR
ncbi:MAG: wax ester/triacylglycerol synthase family O-acyltransferase [Burkholderiales bacterium]|nr:wax ester/triacylglycerol synthase family O-acyltransferase [Burkholderiales bacterium]